MTETDKKKIAFKIARMARVYPSAVEITEETVINENERKISATVKSAKMGVLMDGEHVISMWYEVGQ